MNLRFVNHEGAFFLENGEGDRVRLPQPDEIHAEPLTDRHTMVSLVFADRTSISLTLTVPNLISGATMRHKARKQSPVPGQYLG